MINDDNILLTYRQIYGFFQANQMKNPAVGSHRYIDKNALIYYIAIDVRNIGGLSELYFPLDVMKGLVFLQDRINRLFEERLQNIYTASEIDEGANWSPAVDIYETEMEIYLTAELPGVDLENVRVEVADGELVLKGYRPFPKEGLRRDNYQRLECGYGNFERRFHLPTAVNLSLITANLGDGVLKVVLPKSSEPDRTRIEIDKP